ncbi:MAG: glycosyltransferase family 4 protein [Planctomycetota bacterium]|nr:glycosyltransferase family 4 protein [Planctomycetota bacterium]
MKLIFVTQVLDADDAVLGFVTRWIEGLAANCERVRVIALEVGNTQGLPANVDHRTVGRQGSLRRWLRYRGQLKEAFADGFDTLLTHMVPRYSVVADGLARKAGAGHFLWYTHKGVDQRLINAVKVVDRVFTASAESMRVDTPKKVVTGHGIDLAPFRDAGPPEEPPRLLSVGRLTASKDPLTLIEALALLRERGHDVSLDWAGGGLAAGDDAYADGVRARIAELDLSEHVRLLGAVPHPKIPVLYRQCTLFVSGSRTGSVDKVVLEAMATGRPVVTCNESFPAILGELGGDSRAMLYEPGDVDGLVGCLEDLLGGSAAQRAHLGARLRAIVERDHEVDALMTRLVGLMEKAHA